MWKDEIQFEAASGLQNDLNNKVLDAFCLVNIGNQLKGHSVYTEFKFGKK